jgi:hypothetical protein
MTEELKLQDFTPLLGQTLELSLGDTAEKLEVKEIRPIHNPSPRAAPPFALVLRSATQWRGPQGIYRLHHPELGALEIFFVPIGPDAQGQCYEAVFN